MSQSIGSDFRQRTQTRQRTQIGQLAQSRADDPDAIRRAAQARKPHPGVSASQQNLIIAADHPARGALSAGQRAMAMADRRELIERLLVALENPAVDGVLATADILEDLLLLGALDGKLVFGSMNRGGLAGLVNEIDDRFTAFTAHSLTRLGANGGKMLTRICYEDVATVRTLQACAEAVDALAANGLLAMIEPFISELHRSENGPARVHNILTPEAVITAMSIASGLGGTSAYTWLKIPVVAEMERVVTATTLPIVLLGGDTSADPEGTYSQWQDALALPGVQGLTVGRSLLYPADDDVAAAVSTAASLLRTSSRAPEAAASMRGGQR